MRGVAILFYLTIICVLVTTHALHATEIGREMDLTAYDGAVTVSGDGLLHELINGLLDRDDWRDAVNMPIALVPAGLVYI